MDVVAKSLLDPHYIVPPNQADDFEFLAHSTTVKPEVWIVSKPEMAMFHTYILDRRPRPCPQDKRI